MLLPRAHYYLYLFSLSLGDGSKLEFVRLAIFTVCARIKQRNTSGGCGASHICMMKNFFFVWFYGWPIYERAHKGAFGTQKRLPNSVVLLWPPRSGTCISTQHLVLLLLMQSSNTTQIEDHA